MTLLKRHSAARQKPLVTRRDGLQNLRITDAIVQAAKIGQTVIG
jgi:hypothetical protein